MPSVPDQCGTGGGTRPCLGALPEHPVREHPESPFGCPAARYPFPGPGVRRSGGQCWDDSRNRRRSRTDVRLQSLYMHHIHHIRKRNSKTRVCVAGSGVLYNPGMRIRGVQAGTRTVEFTATSPLASFKERAATVRIPSNPARKIHIPGSRTRGTAVPAPGVFGQGGGTA